MSELDTLLEELEAVAVRLRAGELDPEEAAELVERCADVAARVGAELERAGRRADEPAGQEPLL